MSNENLNLDFGICQLIVKVLNKYKTQEAAAKQLKMSTRNIGYYMKKFGIKKENNVYS